MFTLSGCRLQNSLKTLYCNFASLAASDFPLMPCNIKQSCHSSGRLWMLQSTDENQCWSWPVPNQKAVTTRTGTTSNPPDLFGFSSARQILAGYHSVGMEKKVWSKHLYENWFWRRSGPAWTGLIRASDTFHTFPVFSKSSVHICALIIKLTNS